VSRQQVVAVATTVVVVVIAAATPAVGRLPGIPVRGEWVAAAILVVCLGVLVWARVTAVRDERRERRQR